MALAPSAAARGRGPSRPAIAAVLVSALLYLEILLFGANRTDLALAFAGLWFVALALILTRGWAREALDQVRVRWIGLAFALVIAAGILSLTPLAAGGPHPVWTWVRGGPAGATIDPYLTLVELIKLIALAAAFLIGALFGADDERAKSMFRWLLRLGLIYSFWAFFNRVAEPSLLFGGARSFDPSRLSASLLSANTAATLFGALALLNLVDLDRQFQRHRPSGKLDFRRLERLAPRIALPLVGLAAAATCLILTLSRTGLAATAAAAVILVGAAGVSRARRGAITGPLLAVATILVGIVLASSAINLGSLQDRLSFLGSDTVIRKTIFAAHWTAFGVAPLSGFGLGSFAHINAMIMNQSNVAALDLIGATHNVYLQWLEQAGWVGAAPMFLCIGLITLAISRGALLRRRMRSWLVGVLVVVALFLIDGTTDFAIEVPAMATVLSLLLGLAYGATGASASGPTPQTHPSRAPWRRRTKRARAELAGRGL